MVSSSDPTKRDMRGLAHTRPPVVSFITTIYNGEKWIERAVKYMLDVRWENKEIVLLNDGSSDNTAKICQKLAADTPIVTFLDRPRLGRGRALNEAIEASSGEIIAINDADDVSLSNRLQMTVPLLESRSDLAMVATDTIRFKEDDWDKRAIPAVSFTQNAESQKLAAVDIYKRKSISHSSVLFKKKVWSEVGGYSEVLPNAIDKEFYLRVMKKSNALFLDHPTCITTYWHNTTFRTLGSADMLSSKRLVNKIARENFDIPMSARIFDLLMYWSACKRVVRNFLVGRHRKTDRET